MSLLLALTADWRRRCEGLVVEHGGWGDLEVADLRLCGPGRGRLLCRVELCGTRLGVRHAFLFSPASRVGYCRVFDLAEPDSIEALEYYLEAELGVPLSAGSGCSSSRSSPKCSAASSR